MERYAWAAILVLTASGLDSVQAQPGFPYTPPPAFSPYLNMNRNASPLINYYGVVRPQLDTAKNMTQLEQQLQFELGHNAQATPNRDVAAQGTVTGHPITFMNTSHYFPMLGSPAGGNGGNLGTPRTGVPPVAPTGGYR